jgi:hypothetical protein
MQGVNHERGGQCSVGAWWSALGSTYPGAARQGLGQHRIVGVKGGAALLCGHPE